MQESPINKSFQMFHRKKEEAASVKGKADEKHAQFKVVAKRDSMIIQKGHPSGWVNRGQEKSDAASKGDEWRSEAYVFF